MKQKEIVEMLLKNTYINFLLGAGTSYNQIEGKIHFPLMGDLFVNCNLRFHTRHLRLL